MSRSLREIFNAGNPTSVPDANRDIRMGEALNLTSRFFAGAVATNLLVLPADAKAASVQHAYATAGTAAGSKNPVEAGATVSAGEVAVTGGGNVLFNGTDAITAAEVTYLAYEGEVFEEILPVASDLASPFGSRLAVIILEVESLVGTATGVFGVSNRGTTPGAGNAAITDGGTFEFAAADAVTSARVKYIAQPGAGDGVRDAIGTNLDAENKDY